jgi:hypothetical protein
MPMLHGCAFPGCATLTLSTYCIEHELLARATKETERSHAAHPLEAAVEADAPVAAAADDPASEPAAL